MKTLYTALVLAAGVLLSSFMAVQRPEWLVLAAPVSLAFSVLAADVLDSRLRGAWARPSPGALILATSFLLAGLIVAAGEPAQLRQLLPILGACAATTTLRPRDRRKHCLPQS